MKTKNWLKEAHRVIGYQHYFPVEHARKHTLTCLICVSILLTQDRLQRLLYLLARCPGAEDMPQRSTTL